MYCLLTEYLSDILQQTPMFMSTNLFSDPRDFMWMIQIVIMFHNNVSYLTPGFNEQFYLQPQHDNSNSLDMANYMRYSTFMEVLIIFQRNNLLFMDCIFREITTNNLKFTSPKQGYSTVWRLLPMSSYKLWNTVTIYGV
jgi:hypothetical protein